MIYMLRYRRCQAFFLPISIIFSEALTTYGVIGIKVWIYKGEVFDLENKDSGGPQASK